MPAGAGADFLCYVTPSEHLRLPDDRGCARGGHRLQASPPTPPTSPRASPGRIERDHRHGPVPQGARLGRADRWLHRP
ncbi:MAG: phosphomethylpyrimidine synthase ThiC [Desulfosudis oleivorans]|nr:phosphomethylpyrimidine synthase ThiC [Desulfosudis oleivorans]